MRDAAEANYEREVGDRSDGTDEQGAGHISCVLVHEKPKKGFLTKTPRSYREVHTFLLFVSYLIIYTKVLGSFLLPNKWLGFMYWEVVDNWVHLWALESSRG